MFGNWGKTLAAGNPDQANLISQIAQSGSRFAVTTGDNAYEVGSQKSYGDLYQVGDNTSAVFGPNYWKVAGASLPIFPAIGNHDHNNDVLLTNLPQDTAVATSGGRYQTDRPTAARTARTRPTTRTAGTRSTPGWPASTCSRRPGRTRTSARPTCSRTTSTTTGGPTRRSTSGSRTTSRPIPRALRFAFHHFPLYSDQSATSSDTYLQGAISLEGLLKLHDVTVDFNAHSHNYQRNSVPAGGVPTYVSGGGGANLESIGNHTAGCSAIDQYGLGWSNVNNVGSACGAAPCPPPRTACTTSCS